MTASTSTSDEQPHTFTWPDYDLSGPLLLSLDDYTISPFGSENRVLALASKLGKEIEAGHSAKWLVKAYWGQGKSTILYSLCNLINQSTLKDPNNTSINAHILAIYCNRPQRHKDILDYTVENGLAIPWDGIRSKDELTIERRDLFQRIVHNLALSIYKRFVGKQLNTTEDIDSACVKLAAALDRPDFLKDNPNRRRWNYAYNIGCLLYPTSSPTFLASFTNLFSIPGRGLRDFDQFREFAGLANVHLVVVLDEAEDWRVIRSYRLDEYLLDALRRNEFSLIIVLRTEAEARLRSEKAKVNYFSIRGHLEKIDFPEPSEKDIIDMVEGLLSLRRSTHVHELKPFTKDFVIDLAKQTRRGRMFNPRVFIRALSSALESSLGWKRNSVYIERAYANHRDVRRILADVFHEEELLEIENQQQYFDISFEIARKKEMIVEITNELLNADLNSLNRGTFEAMKSLISKRYDVATPSDQELLGQLDEERRRNKISLLLDIIQGKKQLNSTLPGIQDVTCNHASWEFGYVLNQQNEPVDARKCIECGRVEKY